VALTLFSGARDAWIDGSHAAHPEVTWRDLDPEGVELARARAHSKFKRHPAALFSLPATQIAVPARCGTAAQGPLRATVRRPDKLEAELRFAMTMSASKML
jgi:hypothetical protein